MKILAKRIKFARGHLSRKKYLDLLAAPLARRLQKTGVYNVDDPYSVPKTALRARASRRIRIMAKPKELKSQPSDTVNILKTDEPVNYRETSKRIFELSLPKKRLLAHAQDYLADNRAMLENIAKYLNNIQNSEYEKYRIVCNTLGKRAAKEKLLNRHRRRPKSGNALIEFLKRLATPKRSPTQKSHSLLRSRWNKRGQPNKSIIESLAKPARKPEVFVRPLGIVPFSAKNYSPTERILELAIAKRSQETSLVELGAVKKDALTYQATPKILALAKPIYRKPGLETDLKENAFDVLPRALKAVCSPRTKKLAQPKKYPKRPNK